MKSDLGLEALARIQALDAEKPVSDFRRVWLDGNTLPGRDEALAWMREGLGAAPEAVAFDLDFADPYRVSKEQWSKPSWESKVHRLQGYRWRSIDAEHRAAVHETPSDSPMRALGLLVCMMAESFGREWAEQGHLFVLTGEIPTLRPVVAVSLRSTKPRLRTLSGPLSEEIALFMRPQATTADVTVAYQAAQRRLYEVLDLAPRERIKPMQSQRMRDLAVFGARVLREEFPTWQDARAAFLAEYPDEPSYRDGSTQGTFRRDVRTAYKRVTGLELDFRPTKAKGTGPTAILQLGEHVVTIPAQPAASRLMTQEDVDAAIEAAIAAKRGEQEGGGANG